MNPHQIHKLIHDHLDRHPDRRRAYLDDGTYSMRIRWLESILQLVDEAMDHHGLPGRTRYPILQEVIMGIASAEDAYERVATQARMAAEFGRGPHFIRVDPNALTPEARARLSEAIWPTPERRDADAAD